MLERLPEFEAEYDDVLRQLGDPDVSRTKRAFKALSIRHKELDQIVTAMRALAEATSDLETARELHTEAAGAERDLAKDEIDGAQQRISGLEEEVRALLVPKDPNDGRNVIVEIRGAEGGDEADLFAKDLYDMYQRYADRRSWKVEVLDARPSDLGGIGSVTFVIKGADAWQRLKHEAGPHRVQRVPVTESQGRVHTSSAAVNVLPEVDEVEIEIDPNDLKVDVYRSSGPGGQSVNTTDSAVRVTHVPTGLVVSMQDEKSQIQNRARALQVLRARLYELERAKQDAEQARERKAQVGSGGRSEKIRTYNFKENRVTDHRIGLTLYKLDRVLMGDLDEIMDALLADERSRQLRDGG